MPSINLTDPVNGTTTDASLIAANNDLIEGLVNGGLDDNNISPSAALSPSKLLNFPNDGSKVLLGNGLWGTPPAGGGGGGVVGGFGVLAKFAPLVLSNFSGLTNLISYSVPAGTLGVNKKLALILGGDLLVGGAGGTTRWQIIYGGTTFYDGTTTTLTVSSTRASWLLAIDLAATDAGHQVLYGRFGLSNRGAVTTGIGFIGGGADGWTISSAGALAVDSTVAQNLIVKFAPPSANASNDIRLQAGMLSVVG